jgi:4-amino-4-deoxy-L-arabinose transferase-like glycosyltransferase
MSIHGPAFTAVREAVFSSRFPASMNGSVFLYFSALTSVMCIACLGICVAGWMARDTWRDRYHIHPKSLLFNFRMMMALAGTAAFARSMPEVLYLQMFGDPNVSLDTQAWITTSKRIADSLALWLVLGWMGILVIIYPPLCIALKSGPAKYVIIDRMAAWPRLLRPMVCFLCICLVAMSFAYARVHGN